MTPPASQDGTLIVGNSGPKVKASPKEDPRQEPTQKGKDAKFPLEAGRDRPAQSVAVGTTAVADVRSGALARASRLTAPKMSTPAA